MNETLYINSVTNLELRAERLQQIINALELQQVAVTANSDIDNYKLNDGQTTIETQYRSPDSIAKAIESYERILQSVLNKLNGHCFVLRPWRGLR